MQKNSKNLKTSFRLHFKTKRVKTGRKIEMTKNFIPIRSNPTRVRKFKNKCFLAFDGGDRNQLCVDIWDKAKPQVEYYWQDGTLSALDELRTKELYGQNYSHGRGRGV